jgi:UDP-N-acetyl-D-galactosamine dehydrogenase
MTSKRIVVIGLGYVGLPLAVALARHHRVTGIDIDVLRVEELRAGHDRTREVGADVMAASTIEISSDPADGAGGDIYIVTVPTPVDGANRPDLRPLIQATSSVGRLLDGARQPIIVFESTVYPGVTDDVCGPLWNRLRLIRGRDFFLGYSPERINPATGSIRSTDRESGCGEKRAVTETLAQLYGSMTQRGVFRAQIDQGRRGCQSDRERAARHQHRLHERNYPDLREDRLSTHDVLDAAGTKWNFLTFRPGLVGGHCIGVDPYYLSHCAQSLGHLPRVILAGRSIIDGMGCWIADCSTAGVTAAPAVCSCSGLRSSRRARPAQLQGDRSHQTPSWLGHEVVAHDPLADAMEADREHGIALNGEAWARVTMSSSLRCRTAPIGNLPTQAIESWWEKRAGCRSARHMAGANAGRRLGTLVALDPVIITVPLDETGYSSSMLVAAESPGHAGSR